MSLVRVQVGEPRKRRFQKGSALLNPRSEQRGKKNESKKEKETHQEIEKEKWFLSLREAGWAAVFALGLARQPGVRQTGFRLVWLRRTLLIEREVLPREATRKARRRVLKTMRSAP